MVYSEDLKRRMKAAGRRSAARRAQVEHVCAVCGKVYSGLKQSRYCSNACRQRHKRQKKKEAG